MSRWNGVVQTPASSSPISGKMWPQTPPVSPRVPDRVSVVVPSVSAPRTPLRFADDDGRVRAGFQPSEPSYRGSYSQLRHSISSTGLAASQPFRVSLSQRSQLYYNLDAPAIMFLAVSSVKWDTRVSVRYVGTLILPTQETYSDWSSTRRAEPAPIQGIGEQDWTSGVKPSQRLYHLRIPRHCRVAMTNGDELHTDIKTSVKTDSGGARGGLQPFP